MNRRDLFKKMVAAAAVAIASRPLVKALAAEPHYLDAGRVVLPPFDDQVHTVNINYDEIVNRRFDLIGRYETTHLRMVEGLRRDLRESEDTRMFAHLAETRA